MSQENPVPIAPAKRRELLVRLFRAMASQETRRSDENVYLHPLCWDDENQAKELGLTPIQVVMERMSLGIQVTDLQEAISLAATHLRAAIGRFDNVRDRDDYPVAGDVVCEKARRFLELLKM